MRTSESDPNPPGHIPNTLVPDGSVEAGVNANILSTHGLSGKFSDGLHSSRCPLERPKMITQDKKTRQSCQGGQSTFDQMRLGR